MVFQETKVRDLMVVRREPSSDMRGYFTRVFCQREFEEAALCTRFVQANLCYNEKKGTLRGLHYQLEKQEDKLVACIRGRVWDVCVDLRLDSPTYKKYAAYELSEENQQMLFIPKGCAHGYLTLEDHSQLLYFMSEFYIPGNDAGYRYDDPAFSIPWPLNAGQPILSDKDKNLPYIH